MPMGCFVNDLRSLLPSPLAAPGAAPRLLLLALGQGALWGSPPRWQSLASPEADGKVSAAPAVER